MSTWYKANIAWCLIFAFFSITILAMGTSFWAVHLIAVIIQLSCAYFWYSRGKQENEHQ